MRTYQESLKVYRDNHNAMETAKTEGRLEGASEREVEIARELKKNGVLIDVIEKSTGLTRDQIEKL